MQFEVELDIFSGMPNPSWVLTDGEADNFAKRLARLLQVSANSLSGNLGYRGFIVQTMSGNVARLIRIQAGSVHISENATTAYASDKDRALERWLLATGKPHLKTELFDLAGSALR